MGTGRHRLNEDTVVIPRPQGRPTHRKPEEFDGRQVISAPANAMRAVDITTHALVFSLPFINAVETIYGELRLAHIPARSLGRIIELVGAKLQERLDLPAWDNVDLRTVLRYLASKRKIHFPEALSASS